MLCYRRMARFSTNTTHDRHTRVKGSTRLVTSREPAALYHRVAALFRSAVFFFLTSVYVFSGGAGPGDGSRGAARHRHERHLRAHLVQ